MSQNEEINVSSVNLTTEKNLTTLHAITLCIESATFTTIKRHLATLFVMHCFFPHWNNSKHFSDRFSIWQ